MGQSKNPNDETPKLANTILSDIQNFPDEAEILGRLVVGYGMLELSLWRSLAAVLGNDDEATRVMFQRMGEMARINVVEASLRSAAERLGLGQVLTSAIANFHKCRDIRNRYAHAYWDGSEHFLRSAPLEKAAKRDGDIKILLSPVPLELLHEQEERFIRCRAELDDLHSKILEALSASHGHEAPLNNSGSAFTRSSSSSPTHPSPSRTQVSSGIVIARDIRTGTLSI